MQTFTLEEVAAVIANQYGWHEGAQKTLLKQLLDAAKDGTLIVRHPHTDLPYRPKEHREYYETVGVSDLNRFFEAAGVPWRLGNDGETADRTPNWDKWRHVPELELWECVALWMNIDPHKVKISGCRLAKGYGDFIFDESDEFNERVFVATKNVRVKLQPQAIVMDAPNRTHLIVRQFAAWVREIGWLAPAELLAMADGHDPGKQKAPTPGARPAHNKRATEARNREWQEGIDKLAAKYPTDSHAKLCRKLAKDKGASFPTIRRNTKLRHS